MLRHVPVVEYQTRTVELPSLLEACLTFLQAAMHCVVRDAHRCSAVVVESYVPYSPSARNVLCVVRDAHRCSAVVEVTRLTFFLKQVIRRRCRLLLQALRTLHEDSRRAHRAEKARLKTHQRCTLKVGRKGWRAGFCGCKLMIMFKGAA